MPQMPDTRIPLSGIGGGGGQQDSPLQTLGALLQIKELQIRQQQESQEAQKRLRDMQDDVLIRQTLKESATPIEGINNLYKKGLYSAASTLGTKYFTQQKDQAESYKAQAGATQARLEAATQQLGALDPKDPSVGAAYKTLRPMLLETLAPVYGTAINDVLPTEYDEPTVKRLVMAGTAQNVRLTAEAAAMGHAIEAYKAGITANQFMPGGRYAQPGVEAGAKWSEAYLKIQADMKKSLLTALSHAQNKVQADAYRDTALRNGLSMDEMKGVPEFTDEDPEASRKAAADLLLTPKDIDEAKKTKADIERTEAETAAARARTNYTKARTKAVQEGGGGATPKGITPNRISEIEEIKDTANEKLEQDLRDPAKGYLQKDDPSLPFVDQLNAKGKNEYMRRRLQNENNARRQQGMPTLEDAARHAAKTGDVDGYNKIKSVYEELTAGLKTLDSIVKPPAPNPATMTVDQRKARIDALNAEFDATKDTKRRKEIQDEIKRLAPQLNP